MPGYRDHLLFGALLVVGVATLLRGVFHVDTPTVIVSTAAVLLGAVLPDIDHRGSRVHRQVRAMLVLVATAGAALLWYPDTAVMVAAGTVAAVATWLAVAWLTPRHRTVTHTPRAGLVYAVVVGGAAYLGFGTVVPAAFAALAYWSHLLLDGELV